MPIYRDKERGCYVFEFDRLIAVPEGGTTRLRKRKVLPIGITEQDAIEAGRRLEAQAIRPFLVTASTNGWDSHIDDMVNDKQSWIYKTLAKCRQRRKCSLSPSALATLMRSSRGRCMVTGIPFGFDVAGTSRKRPYHYSLDRIDSTMDYTYENCRVVCYAVNVAMLNWGEGVLQDMAVGYVLNKFGAIGRSLEDGQNVPQRYFSKTA